MRSGDDDVTRFWKFSFSPEIHVTDDVIDVALSQRTAYVTSAKIEVPLLWIRK